MNNRLRLHVTSEYIYLILPPLGTTLANPWFFFIGTERDNYAMIFFHLTRYKRI